MEENKEKVENKEESVKEAEVVTNNETVQEKKVNSYALASFICSLVGLLVCGLPLGIAAVITGGYALNSYKEEKQNVEKKVSVSKVDSVNKSKLNQQVQQTLSTSEIQYRPCVMNEVAKVVTSLYGNENL